MADPVTLASLTMSGLSLLIAGAVAYRAEFRGSRVRLKVVDLPPSERWNSIVAGRIDLSGGMTAIPADIDCPSGPLNIRMTASVGLLLENHAPRDGSAWGWQWEANRLNSPWEFSFSRNLPPTGGSVVATVHRGDTEGGHLTLEVVERGGDLNEAFDGLSNSPPALVIGVRFKTTGAFGREVTRAVEASIERRVVEDALISWALAHGAELVGSRWITAEEKRREMWGRGGGGL